MQAQVESGYSHKSLLLTAAQAAQKPCIRSQKRRFGLTAAQAAQKFRECLFFSLFLLTAAQAAQK